MTPRITAGADADIDDLAAFFESQRPGSGSRFTADFHALIGRLLVRPRLYARINRPPRGREFREGMTTTFPVRVVYEVTPTEIVIWSVWHARRRPRPWRRRLGP
jgi:hypothetical protein